MGHDVHVCSKALLKASNIYQDNLTTLVFCKMQFWHFSARPRVIFMSNTNKDDNFFLKICEQCGFIMAIYLHPSSFDDLMVLWLKAMKLRKSIK